MQKIVFMPRSEAVGLAPAGAIISIHDSKSPPAPLKEGFVDRLTLEFDDKDGPEEGVRLFDANLAEQVLSFVEKNKAVETLYIHCLMGVSRSAAVAIFLGEYYNTPVHHFNGMRVTYANWPHYNKKVYRVLMNQAHGHGDH